MKELIAFYQSNFEKLIDQLWEHLGLTLTSVLLACIISIPLGIWISKRKKLAPWVLNFTGILQTIPSIALLGFLIPFLGIGVKPAILALFLYSLLPIVRNVYTGITQIEPSIIESAVAMGMSPMQVLIRIKLPLALPTIFAGIRTATVINVGVATLAAYIAAGGLGEFIFGGIALNNSTMIIAGALPAALLAILLDFLLGLLQKPSRRGGRRFRFYAPAIVLLLVSLFSFTGSKSSVLKAGFAPEFIGRSDGLPALKTTYELKISNVVLGPALMYKAINEEYVDVISGYSTDGRIKSYKLRVLKDDKGCFPPYHAAMLVNNTTLETHPQLVEIIALLESKINDSIMTHLNFLVDHEKLSVNQVARDFLNQLNLYREPKGERSETIVIGSKIFTEQYILTELYKLLIEGYSTLGVETKNGLGGTKICYDALTLNEIQMYPEYSGTALKVLLGSEKQIQSAEEVFSFVQNQLHEKGLTYFNPIGFNNTYALMMREKTASSLNIESVSELVDFLKRKQ